MADFSKALEKLFELEHRGDCCAALHKNPGESGYTFMGIYQSAHPHLRLWDAMRETAKKYRCDLANRAHRAGVSCMMCRRKDVMREVRSFYKMEFWDRICGDHIASQKIAEEIFIFAANAGVKTAVKRAQELVGATPDGICGPQTLQALNSYDPDLFDIAFDEEEIEYYEGLIARRPSLSIFARGWRNRARAV